MDLFTMQMEKSLEKSAPLAERMRPRNLEEFIGQTHFVGKGKYINRVLEAKRIPSMIFYGPPGVGKTTLAKIVAQESRYAFQQLSAVTSGVKELREVLHQAEDLLKMEGRQTILFIDEIHRFNKSQQDGLLPYVEQGKVILIGATTENPYFEVNKALVSRTQILNFHELTKDELEKLLFNTINSKERGYGNQKITISDRAKEYLIRQSGGDGRTLLNAIEIAVLTTSPVDGKIKITLEIIQDCMQQKKLKYDKGGTDHYDTISAFIKSIRGSDPDAALYWLAKMIHGGEDPKFIARRMIILASEDIGNADPQGIQVAVAAFEAVNIVGLPEGRIPLAQACTYLALAPKSNAAYLGIDRALAMVKDEEVGEVPMYLREQYNPLVEDEKKGKYLYPHNFSNGYVKQNYLPSPLMGTSFYTPTTRGWEGVYSKRLEVLKKKEERDS
ncbi:MAG: replication-associated recombination protein A [Tissierellia bacterium]|nr:replication-associated recombination protein A [Tissierellia bacterium]